MGDSVDVDLDVWLKGNLRYLKLELKQHIIDEETYDLLVEKLWHDYNERYKKEYGGL